MILEIRKLLAKAQYSGEFSYEFVPEGDRLLVPLCSAEGGVKVCGGYEIYEDDAVEINLKLSYELVGQCSYCLKSASQKIEYECQIIFVTQNAKDEEYLYDGNKIDLSVAVNDAFMISQPNVLLCKPDCKGIKISEES